ncbi:MAG: amidohydrolase [Opitutaceae bacterium]|nr:amidohydrolase [Opitutaceae bacterium]
MTASLLRRRAPAILGAVLAAALPAVPARAAAPDLDALKQAALAKVEARRGLTQQMVDSLYSFAEIGFEETESSAYLTGILEREGFAVERGIAGIPTAFVASWGSGAPVIAMMADLDGLPGLSQKPGVPKHDPQIEGGPGHGEGHNTGPALIVTAALAVKELMQAHGLPGTLRVYPGVAEELGASRTYMVQAGLFKDVDAVLGVHVSSNFSVSYGQYGVGVVSTQFTFHGRGAHAGVSPWLGRSALDAVELMDVGWNFRREHLPPEQRSHYVIVDGGVQPNIVPSTATVWYYFRESTYDRIRELHETARRVAQGAAMMTDTTVSEKVIAAHWPRYFNRPMAEAMQANILRVGMPAWSDADQRLARAAQRELGVEEVGLATQTSGLKPPGNSLGGGADDIGEVCWNVPTIVLRYPANIPDMVMHHWSSGIASATPIAHQGTTAGAKAQALMALDLLLRPELVQSAKAFFATQTSKQKWQPLLPPGTTPPLTVNREKMAPYRERLKALRYDPTKYRTYLEQLGIPYPPAE